MNGLIEILAKEWVKFFKLKPYLTAALTGVVISVIAASVTYLERTDREKREALRLESLSYQEQIQQLNQTEKNINQLLEFIDSQKKTLRETEDAISSLKTERAKLQPLIESDKAVVDALFKAQEERASASVWRERLIGFGFGVLASLLASFLWFAISLLWKGMRNSPMQPTAGGGG